MRRVLVMGERPRHLSDAEAADWLRKAAEPVVALDGVARAQLVWLESPEVPWPRTIDWFLELYVTEGGDPHALVHAEQCTELLRDLLMLGMRPSIVLADSVETGLPGESG